MREDIIVFPFDPYEYPFNIEVSGISYCTDVYYTNRPDCHTYIFEYIVKGQGTLVYNGTILSPKQGDVYILHKGSDNYYFPDKEDPWTKIWFNVDGLLVSSLLASYHLSNTVLIEHFNDEALFREMYDLTRSSRPIETILDEAAIQFHRLLQRMHEHECQKVIKDNSNTIKRILDAHLYDRFNLQEITDTLYLSKAQIIRIFKEHYGLTPYQYFIKQKIRLSVTMLLNSSMSIKEIAESLSFADQHYFSNTFKSILGVSPTTFRREKMTVYNKLANVLLKQESLLESPDSPD